MNDETMSHAKLHELLWSFAAHRTITVAGRTGILAAVAEEPAGARKLSARLGLKPGPVEKILKALVALDILEVSQDGYRVRPGLLELFACGDEGLGPFLEHHHRLYDSWGANLEGWVRGEEWRSPERTPEDTALFARAMRSNALRIAGRAMPLLDLEKTARLLDVGGGTGTYARTFAEAHEDMRAVVLDLPAVAEMGREQVRGTSLEGRVSFRGGDYENRVDYGDDNDLVLFANVLHQVSRDRAAAFIAHGADALRPGGRVAVIDFSVAEPGERSVSPVGALFAINMRSFGDTHSAGSYQTWFEAAGLMSFERRDLDDTRWILTARKPD